METLDQNCIWSTWLVLLNVYQMQLAFQKTKYPTVNPDLSFSQNMILPFMNFFLKKWVIPGLFYLFSSFRYTVDSKQRFNINIFFCRWLDSNRVLLVMEATALPTDTQPPPFMKLVVSILWMLPAAITCWTHQIIFFFIIHSPIAVNYGNWPIYVEIYLQNLAIINSQCSGEKNVFRYLVA